MSCRFIHQYRHTFAVRRFINNRLILQKVQKLHQQWHPQGFHLAVVIHNRRFINNRLILQKLHNRRFRNFINSGIRRVFIWLLSFTVRRFINNRLILQKVQKLHQQRPLQNFPFDLRLSHLLQLHHLREYSQPIPLFLYHRYGTNAHLVSCDLQCELG